jgi:hypothetical protein
MLCDFYRVILVCVLALMYRWAIVIISLSNAEVIGLSLVCITVICRHASEIAYMIYFPSLRAPATGAHFFGEDSEISDFLLV